MEIIAAIFGGVVVALGAVWAAITQAKRRGKAEIEILRERDKKDATEQILDDVRLANEARSNLRSNSDERQRLYGKYKRQD